MDDLLNTFSWLGVGFRWLHILGGITWIGLLYYFNFVQGPFVAGEEADVKGAITRRLAPRALWWFRWGALVTLLAGVGLILLRWNEFGFEINFLKSDYFLAISTGMGLGLIMFLNVWLVIWPNQQIVIASAEAAAGGGAADPRAADAARKALLASRTNVLFSIAMVWFMAGSAHYSKYIAGDPGGTKKLIYAVAGLLIAGLLELNALKWDGFAPKTYLETVRSVITSGFVLWAVLLTLSIALL